MKYIKYKNSRVNLENIIGYRPHSDVYLMFNYNSCKKEGPQKHITWEFENKDARNKTLKEIDKITKVNNINVKNGSVSGHVEVKAEVI